MKNNLDDANKKQQKTFLEFLKCQGSKTSLIDDTIDNTIEIDNTNIGHINGIYINDIFLEAINTNYQEFVKECYSDFTNLPNENIKSADQQETK
jgi:hypothetical protein